MEDLALDAAWKAYVRNDYSAAIKNFMPIARRGNARAQFFVGDMYCFGHGLQRDPQQAFRWFRLSAEQGFELAQHNLGIMYHKGEGTHQDDRRALWWSSNAARWGNADAQFNVGQHYFQGLGTKEDASRAVCWYHAAARQGHLKAQNRLANMFLDGSGIEPDLQESFFWFCLALQGNPDALHKIAQIAAEQLSPDQVETIKKAVSEWKPWTPLDSAIFIFKTEYQEFLDEVTQENKAQVLVTQAAERLQRIDRMLDVSFVLGEPLQEETKGLSKLHAAYRESMVTAVPELLETLTSLNDLRWASRAVSRSLGLKKPDLESEPKQLELAAPVHQ